MAEVGHGGAGLLPSWAIGNACQEIVGHIWSSAPESESVRVASPGVISRVRDPPDRRFLSIMMQRVLR